MKSIYKVVAIVVVISLISSFTAINLYSEPAAVGLSPGKTPYNIVDTHNCLNLYYRAGYLNFSGYGNKISYVYKILPLQGRNVVSQNYCGPFISFSIYKVSQKTVFPFTNTSLYVHVTFQPYEYLSLNSPNIRSQVYHYPGSFISGGERGSIFSYNNHTGIHKFYVNMTLTPVFDMSIYHISGKSKTLHFVFNINVTRSNVTNQ